MKTLLEIKQNSKLEKDTTNLLFTILCNKNLKAVPKCTWIILCVLCLVIIPLVIYFWNKYNLKITYLFDFLSNLLTILSVLIGFSITAISMLGIGISKNTIKNLKKYKSDLYPKASIYDASIYVFFEYLYSLLFSLMFIVCCLFLKSYLFLFMSFKVAISAIFFYILLLLIYWNCLSIKSLAYNLYAIIVINNIADDRNQSGK